jgi:hypothetical protein
MHETSHATCRTLPLSEQILEGSIHHGDPMLKFLTPLPLLLFLLPRIPEANSAEAYIRPGLWEITTTSMLLGLMPQIPPDQMRNLTNLAKQYGLEVPQIRNGAATSRICITRQMAEQEIPSYFHAPNLGCGVKNAVREKNSYKMDLVCVDSLLKGDGRAEGTFATPETFSGWTIFNGKLQNTPVSENADTSGRWISANCGQ